jgi:hypothetical protein
VLQKKCYWDQVSRKGTITSEDKACQVILLHKFQSISLADLIFLLNMATKRTNSQKVRVHNMGVGSPSPC